MADQAGRLAYAHGSAFTTEPLEAYAREVGRPPAGRRPGDLPRLGRVRGDRDGAQAGPRLPPGPRRAGSAGSCSRAGGATTATRSAPSTCPVASRCADRTRAGSAASGTSRRPIHTGPDYPARTPSARPTSLPPSSIGRSTAAGPGPSPRSWRNRSSARPWPPPSRRTATGRPSPRSAGATASLLIADEVMTGFGRTGRWFGARPLGRPAGHPRRGQGRDVRATGRSGSWRPRTRSTHAVTRPGSGFVHGFTYSHAPVGAAVAREVLRILESESLVEASATKGERLRDARDDGLRRPPGGRRDPRSRPDGRHRAGRGPRDPGAVPAGGPHHGVGRRGRPRPRRAASIRGPATPNGVDGDTILLGPPFIVTDAELERIADGPRRDRSTRRSSPIAGVALSGRARAARCAGSRSRPSATSTIGTT